MLKTCKIDIFNELWINLDTCCFCFINRFGGYTVSIVLDQISLKKCKTNFY